MSWFHGTRPLPRGIAETGGKARRVSRKTGSSGIRCAAPAIERVARECAEDLAADGVVYAEIRFAPELHTERGLDLDEVIEAVITGFEAGAAGTDLTIRIICSAMRHLDRGLEVAQAAVRHRDHGVVG